MAATEHPPTGPTVSSIRVITAFYSKMLQSSLLHRHFAGVSMEGLVAKQSALIDAISTDAPLFPTEEMHRVHAHLRIDGTDYDEMLRLLALTIQEREIDSAPAAAIQQVFTSYRDAIVTEGGDSDPTKRDAGGAGS